MNDSVSLVWFRLDLRLTDNLALAAAVAQSAFVVPVYIVSPVEDEADKAGSASRWWLDQSLCRLNQSLLACGSRLVIRNGSALETLRSLITETGARSVYWNRRYDPLGVRQDTAIEAALASEGIKINTYNSSLLHEPSAIHTKAGRPFQVFTAFWNNLSAVIDTEAFAGRPNLMPFPDRQITGILPEALAERTSNKNSNWAASWTPGECAAQGKLGEFLRTRLEHYDSGRDRPDQDGVSMLSPHLHFGEIGPRQILRAVYQQRNLSWSDGVASENAPMVHGADTYAKELGWREFAHHILFHFPDTINRPLKKQFERFPWSNNDDLLRRWQEGSTGFPIVDAGMRQLAQTGWMHNRVRMIVASFLTKDLLISWRHGASWFFDSLVDADLASNTFGWQWSAGCGADAAPYFRIFNPELQGEKFDPEGNYVRSWLPELGLMPTRWIHKPSKAPLSVLLAANVSLGRTYPKPVVDHALARRRALEGLAWLKQASLLVSS